jgi:hypothetical protein
MNEKNADANANTIKMALAHLLELISSCPRIIKDEMGAEAFVKELHNVAVKFFNSYSPETIGAMKELKPCIEACPQIFKSGIGIEAFIDELSSAATKFKI